jgi:Tfp pilus assembly PilM family ATPase
VQRSLSVKTASLAMDFLIIGQPDPHEIEIFFAAARKEYVDQYCDAFVLAGLKVAMMEVDIFAMLRAVRFALREELAGTEKICAFYLSQDYAVIAGAQDDGILFYQQWDSSQNLMSCLQWVEWCCHTYQHMKLNVTAIGGEEACIYEAVKIIASQWSCKIYEPDPFHNMQGKSALGVSVVRENASAFLLASGLAMREAQ